MRLRVWSENLRVSGFSLGHFQVGSYRYRSLIEGLYTFFRSFIEALYTLNSPPVVSFNSGFQNLGSWRFAAGDPLLQQF